MMKKDCEDERGNVMPEAAKIIGPYLLDEFEPAVSYDPDCPGDYRLVTSQAIVLELSDMVELSINEVAAAMVWFGFRTKMHYGSVGWLLRRKNRLACE